MLVIDMPNDFDVGQTRDVRINGEDRRLRYLDEETLAICAPQTPWKTVADVVAAASPEYDVRTILAIVPHDDYITFYAADSDSGPAYVITPDGTFTNDR